MFIQNATFLKRVLTKNSETAMAGHVIRFRVALFKILAINKVERDKIR